jgi:hypothetical protein
VKDAMGRIRYTFIIKIYRSMKALIEKKVVREPYAPSEDLNGKMVSETATIYFLRLPIFKRTTIMKLS